MTTKITYKGRTQSAPAWARELGINYRALRWRLEHWPIERALTTPKQPGQWMITHNGRTQSASAWARELGITYHLLRWRLEHWPIERALTTPKQSGQVMLTHEGRTQSASAWARELGMTFRGLKSRLQRGLPVAKALSYRKRDRSRNNRRKAS